jgi:hypothetical protein
MEKKNLMEELTKIASLAKCKLQRFGGFCAFTIVCSLTKGNRLVQIEPGETKEDKIYSFGQMTDWLKLQDSYMFFFGTQILRQKYISEVDMNNNAYYTETKGILIIAKTPESTHHLTIEYVVQDGKYIFTEELTNETNTEYDDLLGCVYEKSN